MSYLRAIRVQYNPEEFVPRGIGLFGVVLIEFFYKMLPNEARFCYSNHQRTLAHVQRELDSNSCSHLHFNK